jgi:hypothetical protein
VRSQRVLSTLLALCLVLSCAPITLAAQEAIDLDAAQTAARAVVDDFFIAFNEADNARLGELLNYPHVFILGEGTLRTALLQGDADIDFESLRTTQDWARSSIQKIDTLSVAPEAVIFRLTFQRTNTAGKVYWTTPALWIVTKNDDHWGIQVRSLHLRAVDKNARRDAESGAEAALRAFYDSWNLEDNPGLRIHMNFPFANFFGGNLQLALTPEAYSTDFERLRAGGWERSEIESLQALSSSADKVHFRVVFNRRSADGEILMRARMLYILTRRGDHWGMQLRTSMPTL